MLKTTNTIFSCSDSIQEDLLTWAEDKGLKQEDIFNMCQIVVDNFRVMNKLLRELGVDL